MMVKVANLRNSGLLQSRAALIHLYRLLGRFRRGVCDACRVQWGGPDACGPPQDFADRLPDLCCVFSACRVVHLFQKGEDVCGRLFTNLFQKAMTDARILDQPCARNQPGQRP